MGRPVRHSGPRSHRLAVIFQDTSIIDAKQISFEAAEDERGSFGRIFCEQEVAAAAWPFHVRQINLSTNHRQHTLRGLHYQAAPRPDPKIVRCVQGRVWDVIVDLRQESPSRLSWHGAELSAKNGNAMLVPPGCAHGFITLCDNCELVYLMGEVYVPELARGVRWDDPAFKIDWPAKPGVIAPRDAGYPDHVT